MGSYDEFPSKGTWIKWGGIALVAVAALMVIGTVFGVFGSFLQGEADEVANPSREKGVLFDPNNSIGTYEHFYDQCREVVALTAKVENAEEELAYREKHYNPEADPFGEERVGINGLRESIRALENQQVTIAEQYNADSSKTTQAQFKAADLPYTIDPPYAGLDCGSAKEAGR